MNNLYSILGQSNWIVLNRDLVLAIGLDAAYLYSHLLDLHKYYSNRGQTKDGWFFATQADIQKRIGMRRRAQDTCEKALTKIGLIQIELKGMPATKHYKFPANSDEVLLSICTQEPNKFGAIVQTVLAESDKLDCTKNTNKIGTIVQQTITDKQEQKTKRDNSSELENSQPVASLEIEKEKPANDLAIAQFKQVIDYLNLKSGRAFQITAQDMKGKTDKFKLISKTLKSYTLEDIKLVIDDRVNDWGSDSKMSRFLQPATIFAHVNFEKYIEAIRAGQPQQKDQPNNNDKLLIENVWAVVGVLGCTGDKNQIGAICKRLAAIIKPEHRSDNGKIGEAAVAYIKKAKEVGENSLENMNKNFDSLLTKIKQTAKK